MPVTSQALSRFAGMEIDLMGGGLISFFFGGGGVVRYRGVMKEKLPDFRSPEVGISAFGERFSPFERLWKSGAALMLNQGT